MWSSKDVYYVSDSAAILSEDLGRSLLCQFPQVSFYEQKIPFVRTKQDGEKAIKRILEQSGGRRPLVFCSIMDQGVREIIHAPEVDFFDLVTPFLLKLENCLEVEALRAPGFFRQNDETVSTVRVDAIHFALEHDDGVNTEAYEDAEIILLGVSRSGKTPVTVYLASHMGLKAANYPLTSEQLDAYELPPNVIRNRKKTVGLTTSAQMLHKIREKRYHGSTYAKIATCSSELQQAQEMFRRYNIPVINTEGKSIEEISVQSMQLLGISKKK